MSERAAFISNTITEDGGNTFISNIFLVELLGSFFRHFDPPRICGTDRTTTFEADVGAKFQTASDLDVELFCAFFLFLTSGSDLVA